MKRCQDAEFKKGGLRKAECGAAGASFTKRWRLLMKSVGRRDGCNLRADSERG